MDADKKKKTRNESESLVAGAGLERCDLWVMSPTSYQLLHPASRGISFPIHAIYSNINACWQGG